MAGASWELGGFGDALPLAVDQPGKDRVDVKAIDVALVAFEGSDEVQGTIELAWVSALQIDDRFWRWLLALFGESGDGWRAGAFHLRIEIGLWDVGDANGLLGLMWGHAGTRSRLLARVKRLGIRPFHLCILVVLSGGRLNLLEQFAGPADGSRCRLWRGSLLLAEGGLTNP